MIIKIEEIKLDELRDALAWALDFVHKKFEHDAAKLSLKGRVVVAFAAAHLLAADDIDMPAGDRRLYDRLDDQFQHAFNVWYKDK